MIAVDTNVLVYAHRDDISHHRSAQEALSALQASGDRWALPWPCVHEFLSTVTSSRIWKVPTPSARALQAIEGLVDLPEVTVIGESRRHLELLHSLLEPHGVAGPMVHDARIAAICLGHGVDELWTADRDFGYFPALRTRNPLVA